MSGITEFFNGDEYFKLFTNFNYEDGKFNQRYKNHQSYDEIKNEPIGMLMNPKYYENEGDDENEVAKPFIKFLNKLTYHLDFKDNLRTLYVEDILCFKTNNFLKNFIEVHKEGKKLNDEEIENICKIDDKSIFDDLKVKFLVEKFASTLPLLKKDMVINGDKINSIDTLKTYFNLKINQPKEKIEKSKNRSNTRNKIKNNREKYIKENDTQIEINYPFKWEKFISDYMDKRPENLTINDEIFEEHEFGNLMKRDVTGLYYLDENSDRIYVDKGTSAIKVAKEDSDKMKKIEELEILINLEEDENKRNELQKKLEETIISINREDKTEEGCYGLNECEDFIKALISDKIDGLELLQKYDNNWYTNTYNNIKNINPNILKRFLNKFEIKKVKIFASKDSNFASNDTHMEYYIPMKYEDWIKNLLNKGQEQFVFKLQSNKYEKVNTFFKAIIDFLRKEVNVFNRFDSKVGLESKKLKKYVSPELNKDKLKLTGHIIASKPMTESDYASKFIEKIVSQTGGFDINNSFVNVNSQEIMFNNIKKKLLEEGINIDNQDELKINNSINELKTLDIDLKKSINILKKLSNLSKMTGGLGSNIKSTENINDIKSANNFSNENIIELKQFIENNLKLQEKINNELNNNIWPKILGNI
tara:strand:+ start:194 stop:2134 length:1941 start_codon:yes stop_codon:yes gene_type:complete